MSSLPQSPARSPSITPPLLRRIGAGVVEMAGRVAQWWRDKRRKGADRKILMSMSARELNDIGLGRGEVHGVVRFSEHRRGE